MTEIRVARLVECDAPLQVGTAAKPSPGPHDVLVRVKACGFVPNTANVVRGHDNLPLPPLPAIFGLDVSGVIEEVGSSVVDLTPGERVYVDPYLSCQTCHHCRRGRRDLCGYSCLRGYMTWNQHGHELLAQYPYGGLSEYVVSPQTNIVRIGDTIDFYTAARFGYLGTSFGALMRGGFQPGQTVLINGITGTLGVAATAMALGMGALQVIGTGRNQDVIKQLVDLAPGRVHVFDAEHSDVAQGVLDLTRGLGADMMYDCLGYGSKSGSTDALLPAVKYGGAAVLVAAGVLGDIRQSYFEILLHDVHPRGSMWFDPGDADRMVELIDAGVIDFSFLEHRVFELDDVNEALTMVDSRPGGFVNVVVSLE